MKRDLTKICFDELYSKPQLRKYKTDEINYKHFDEMCSIDLADLIDYKTSNKRGY